MPRTLRLVLLLSFVLTAGCASEQELVPLFNGRDLSGWRNINTAPSTWTVRDGVIVTSGLPTGELCTTRQYENFVLELEWRHMKEGGNAGLFVHSDPLPAVGQPFTRAIEMQVMDGNHGDVFSIHGATMVPDRPHPQGWSRSLPSEKRANPTGEWNHYRVESRDGTVSLAVNGKVVSGGSEISPRKGYICLESEGSEAHFRNIRVRELPSTDPPAEATADAYEGFHSLYTGVDLSGWKTPSNGSWKADNWILQNTGASAGDHLWTEESFGDFDLIVDWRVQCDPDTPAPTEATRSAVLLRGTAESRILIGCAAALPQHEREPDMAALTEDGAGPRGWRRMYVRVRGGQVTVDLDGARISETRLPDGTPARGAIGLANYGAPVQFANLFIKHAN